jgi:uncharacterized protein with HEPN domain
MLEAAEDAVAFGQGQSRRALDHDRKLTLALLKSIEIIGEAAARITVSTRSKILRHSVGGHNRDAQSPGSHLF